MRKSSSRLPIGSPIPKNFEQLPKHHLISPTYRGIRHLPYPPVFLARSFLPSRATTPHSLRAPPPPPRRCCPTAPASLRSAAAPPWSCKTHPISVRPSPILLLWLSRAAAKDSSPSPPREPMLLQGPALFERLIPQLMEVPQLRLRATEQPSRNLALPSMEEIRSPHRCCAGHTRARRRVGQTLRSSLPSLF